MRSICARQRVEGDGTVPVASDGRSLATSTHVSQTSLPEDDMMDSAYSGQRAFVTFNQNTLHPRVRRACYLNKFNVAKNATQTCHPARPCLTLEAAVRNAGRHSTPSHR